MRFPSLVVASKNPDKVREVEAILAEVGIAREVVRGLEWPDVEETEETLEGNALLKARSVVAATGLPALADDTGLEVEALGGGPGVRTGRYAGPEATDRDNVEKLLAALEGAADRSARFRTAVAVVEPGGGEWVVSASLEGTIAREARGEGGFGYDPVFEVDGRTLSEMGEDEKNRLSHRARAIRAMARLLGEE